MRKYNGNGLSIKDYSPLEGFYDLRDFDLPDKVFAIYYEIQLLLHSCEAARKKGLYKYRQAELSRIKEFSAQYQQALLSYPEKPKPDNTN